MAALDVQPRTGLSHEQVLRRREQFGANVLKRTEKTSALRILVGQFKSLLVGLLAVGALISFLFGDVVDGTAILAVVVVNAAIGFVTELRAVREMEALRELGSIDAIARRGGQLQTVAAADLVPGDIVLFDAGDVVTVDARLIETSRLQIDESSLTGESIPRPKSTEPLDPDIHLADQANMLYKGTAVTRGGGEGVVVATGMNTELGRITALVQGAADGKTPLEQRLDRLGRVLVYVSLGFAVLVVFAGIASGKPALLVIETAIALLVATVPEGLPIVATIALARGMSRMAARNVLIEQLAAVETLGSTNIILTDKTGTLTENQMTVSRLVTANLHCEVTGLGLSATGELRIGGARIDVADHPDLEALLVTAALCTDATVGDGDDPVGDPMEIALLLAAAKAGWSEDRLNEAYPLLREEAFDPDERLMGTAHRAPEGDVLFAVKGAPEAVFDACRLDGEARPQWEQRNQELASQGLRVLAIARKRGPDEHVDPFVDLEIVGLTGLVDPPRQDVRDAIAACSKAGIRVVMVTGDQAATAVNVAHATGMGSDPMRVLTGRELDAALDSGDAEQVLAADVLARTTPEQKLSLIGAHQAGGAIVAMVGDGVNDAPALRKADIGVAMGLRGTQVAREASDMVLRDDRFGSILAAIEEGRVIFRNIRTFVVYLISCNLSEIVVVGSVSMFAAPLPVTPLQILFLNLVTDVFPALALGVSGGDAEIMDAPPRPPGEPVLTRQHWKRIVSYGLLLSASVIGSYLVALNGLQWSDARVVSVTFLTLALAQLFHVFNMADNRSHPLVNEVTRNPWVWAAIGLCLAIIACGIYVPGLRDVLGLQPPGLVDLGIVLAFATAPAILGRAWAFVRHRRELPTTPAVR